MFVIKCAPFPTLLNAMQTSVSGRRLDVTKNWFNWSSSNDKPPQVQISIVSVSSSISGESPGRLRCAQQIRHIRDSCRNRIISQKHVEKCGHVAIDQENHTPDPGRLRKTNYISWNLERSLEQDLLIFSTNFWR